MKNKIILQAPAKINLFLDITGKLENGYHTLETMMVPISIFDEISLELNEQNCIQIDKSSTGNIPKDEKNIAWKAADLFLKKLGKKAGVNIGIKKNIPVEAGLGGGSSDGACVLNGLNELFSFPFSDKVLEEISAPLGADVPFFIKQKPAFCTGIGDSLEHLEKFNKKFLIVVNPGKGLSTALVYKKLNWGLTNSTKKNKRLLFEDCLEVKSKLSNDLEPVSEELMPEITEIKARLKDFDAEIAMMSGSGPTCFGVYRNQGLRDKALSGFLKNCRPSWKVFSAEFV